MFVWTGPWSRAQEASPLLRRLAGEFADRIAAVWAPPHGPFLIAPAPRRHLVCLLLSRGEVSGDRLELALNATGKRDLKALIAAPPPGLFRALERMGEDAWTAAEYQQLLAVLGDPARAKVLHHAQALTAAAVQGVADLPAPVVRAGAGQLGLNPEQSAMLSEAWRAITVSQGSEAADRAAARWGRANSARQLFDWAVEDVVTDIPPVQIDLAPGLKLLATKADFRDAAARFRNCLKSQIAWAATGGAVYLEWTGQPPAVLQISRDAAYGWRLNEAKGVDNAIIPLESRFALLEALETSGVHVGSNHWCLTNRLEAAGRGEAIAPGTYGGEDAFGDYG